MKKDTLSNRSRHFEDLRLLEVQKVFAKRETWNLRGLSVL